MVRSVPRTSGCGSQGSRVRTSPSHLLRSFHGSAPQRVYDSRHIRTPCLAPTGAATAADASAAAALSSAWELRKERGVAFVTGEAFYRAESCAGRDLAILAAVLQRQRTGRLHVLDVMAGSGMRGARYLTQADADEVWINDGSTQLHDAMVYNMCTAAGLPVAGLSEASHLREGVGFAPEAPAGATEAGALGGLGPGQRPMGHDVAASEPEPFGAQSLRDLAAGWEAQAQRLRLEGLSRDVWQWDVQRLARAEHAPSLPASTAAAEANEGALGVSGSGGDRQKCGSASGQARGGGIRDGDIGGNRSAGGCVGLGNEQTKDSFSGRRIRISHADANRLLTNCYMRESYYDLVDVDSFGSETMHFPAAIDAVRYGGLLYLTSTDGFTSSGKRPARGLAAYGSYLRATPWANEQGLRMIIGAAVREAAARGVTLQPVFSLYSYHGPVFRVMLRAIRSAEWPAHHYGFMGHCFVHGDNYTVGWRGLGAATCRCEARGRRRPAGPPTHGPVSAGGCDAPGSTEAGSSAEGGSRANGGGGACSGATVREQVGTAVGPAAAVGGGDATGASTPLVLSGPLWTGPLHDEGELRAMAAEANRRGWTGFGLDAEAAPHLRNRAKSSRNVRPLEELLAVLIEEANPHLPPGFFSIDDSVARRLARPPPRDALIEALRAEGFAAARCHLEARAFRTDACMADVLRVAEERLGIPRRR
ncbi:hypothetical protein PLESTF_001246700 [Pleodorina starrii]|nr:hypothetical protein PLESTM_000389800 [Pleodorina starrii]GLC72430.1 hypothetical protein PLESTF_001246700 [Pleodorina starrii]